MASCRSRLTTASTTAMAVIVAIACLAACKGTPPPVATDAKAARPTTGGIAGLGRIEAGQGIVRLAVRSLGGQASIVSRILVKEGDRVHAGQVVAELDSKPQLEATTRQAVSAIDVARKRLAQARAGAKPADVAAQQAEVDRIQQDLANAQKDLERHKSLGDNVTAAEIDRLQLRVDSANRARTSAQQRLAGLKDVRGVDVAVAQSELEQAIRNEARTRAESDASVIQAPMDGRVVKVHSWPGEAVGNEGLLELAPLSPMYAVAEISEADIARVKAGQRATITGNGLKSPINGTVERVSTKVLQNQVMPVDPANFSDARVVEVWVRLDDPAAVADLIHLRVDVIIQP